MKSKKPSRGFRRRWKAIGHRGLTYGPRVVLEDEEGGTEAAYSTKQLAKLLEYTRELFFSEKDRFDREMFFAASENQKLKIQVQPTRSFQNAEGREIFWNPIGVDKYPDPQKLEEFQRIAMEDFQQEKLHACTPPKHKDWKKAIDMEEGSYLVPCYGKKRGAAGANGVEQTKGLYSRNGIKGWLSRDGIKGAERTKGWFSKDELVIGAIAHVAKNADTLSWRCAILRIPQLLKGACKTREHLVLQMGCPVLSCKGKLPWTDNPC